MAPEASHFSNTCSEKICSPGHGNAKTGRNLPYTTLARDTHHPLQPTHSGYRDPHLTDPTCHVE